MVPPANNDDLSLSSPIFPGGSLLSAVFDRDLMRLSDRGGASGMIGDRWSDVCSTELESWPDTHLATPHGMDVHVDRIIRLDDIPSVARVASKRKLQNPDYIVAGRAGNGGMMLSADAKFSVETAGASQVSAEVLRSLVEVGPSITAHFGDLDVEGEIVDGIFLSPDYSLTHYMMRRKRGYRSVSVDHRQIRLLPVRSVPFLKPLEGARMIPIFAEVDGYDRESRTSLMVGLYYFRLVRAAVGCWADMVAPLLVPKGTGAPELASIEERTRTYARDAASGWDIVERWDAAAESVRNQREVVNRITSVPIVNRELRGELDAAVRGAGVEAPSMNKVRRRIGSWFRNQVVNRVGVLQPPITDFPRVIHDLELVSAEIRQELPAATTRIIHEMLDEIREDAASTAEVLAE
jgi:hypothetical protein